MIITRVKWHKLSKTRERVLWGLFGNILFRSQICQKIKNLWTNQSCSKPCNKNLSVWTWCLERFVTNWKGKMFPLSIYKRGTSSSYYKKKSGLCSHGRRWWWWWYEPPPRANVTLINLVLKIESKPRIEWNCDRMLNESTNLGIWPQLAMDDLIDKSRTWKPWKSDKFKDFVYEPNRINSLTNCIKTISSIIGYEYLYRVGYKNFLK